MWVSRDDVQAGGGIPRYLYAVQLLGQDAEKVVGEVTQQWWVPVPIAPLAQRGPRAQHISAGGWEVTARREQSGQTQVTPRLFTPGSCSECHSCSKACHGLHCPQDQDHHTQANPASAPAWAPAAPDIQLSTHSCPQGLQVWSLSILSAHEGPLAVGEGFSMFSEDSRDHIISNYVPSTEHSASSWLLGDRRAPMNGHTSPQRCSLSRRCWGRGPGGHQDPCRQ